MKLKENYVRGAEGTYSSIEEYLRSGSFEHALDQLRGKKGLIVAAGGQAPGLNMVVKNLVSWTGSGTEFYGLNGGFPAIGNWQENITRLTPRNKIDTRLENNSINTSYTAVAPKSDGTTLLLEMGRGSDGDSDVQALASFMQQHGFDFLVTLGGNGTLAATNSGENALRNIGWEGQIIHVPKTVDGDLYGETFGLHSAADYTRNQIKRLTSEHNINGPDPVLNLFEIMGRSSARLPLETAAICRQIDLVIVPGLRVSQEFVNNAVNKVLSTEKGMNILIAEGVESIHGIRSPEAGQKRGSGERDEERMVDVLGEHLSSRFGRDTMTKAKINLARWSYDLRAVGEVVAEDEKIISGMCDTVIRALATGAKGTSVIGTGKVLDLESTEERPPADWFPMDNETRLMLIRQGYSERDIDNAFRQEPTY